MRFIPIRVIRQIVKGKSNKLCGLEEMWTPPLNKLLYKISFLYFYAWYINRWQHRYWKNATKIKYIHLGLHVTTPTNLLHDVREERRAQTLQTETGKGRGTIESTTVVWIFPTSYTGAT